MDEMFALAAGLQFAYWFWNATVQPGMTRFSDKIGETLGEIGAERLKRWFGARPPTDVQGQVDESDATQQKIITMARSKIKGDAEWDSTRFMDTTKREVVRLLRNPAHYSMADLSRLWQDFGDPGVAWGILVARHGLVGDAQAGIADELVMYTIQRRTLPKLIAAMRRV